MENVKDALARMTAVLGADAVVQGSAVSQFLCCTTGVQREVPAVVFAASPEDVHAVVDIARQHRVPLYPISTGNNWGYGSANPVVDGCIVLNLSRMDRILAFDPGTGLVTLEPGVTQGKLAEFLAKVGQEYMVPTTGAGPSGSIVGNALERGYGITPLADHFGALIALEAALPDGTHYRSPLSDLGVGSAGFKWGIGPYLDGLFTQGAFGVVTQATIALAARPEQCQALLFRIDRAAQLDEAVERVRSVLTELGSVVGGINLMNARRVLAMTAPYPGGDVDKDGVIPDAVLDAMCRRYQIAPWTGYGTLYGTARMVAAARGEIRRRLRGVASRIMFVSPQLASRLHRAVQWVRPARQRLGPMLSALRSSLELVQGMPNETALRLAYWKQGSPREGGALDPARDRCGLLWYAPLVSMNPVAVRTYVDFVTTLMPRFGMEPLITLTSLSDRCFSSTVPILYDLEVAGQQQAASDCYRELLDGGRSRGFFPYRLGVQSMEWLMRISPEHWQLVSALKSTIDPHGIISPGRYSLPR